MQSSNTTQSAVDRQPQGASRPIAGGGYVYAPEPAAVDPKVVEEIRHLTEVESRLAQKYGIAFHEVTDSTAVLQEAKRRARSPLRRAGSTISAILLAKKNDENNDVENLQRLLDLRYKYGSQSTISSLTPDTQVVVDASRFWAVLIGIDGYTQRPLRGCVSDALLMRNFLTDELGVPKEHIQCLLGPDSPTDSNPKSMTPSRTNIINTLYSLVDNPHIKRGDNIIIYFSGHGSSYELSDFYEAGDIAAEGSIEALCPVDRTASGTESSIPDISDREINIILAEIAHAKGNHITLILDCCYSSGASRDPSESPNVVRHATSLPATSIKDMLEAADTRLGKLSRYHSVFERNWKPDMTSHVVLAACAETQYAEEAPEGGDNRWNGVFTQALVKALKSNGLKEDSTYVDLIRASKMPQNTVQRPVIAGNSSARLWYQPKKVPESPWSQGSWFAWLLSGVGVSIGVGAVSIACQLLRR